MDDDIKLTVFYILENVGFYDNILKKGLKTARMRDALYKTIAKIRNLFLPVFENVSDGLQGEGVKIFKQSNITHSYIRLENILGLKLSAHTVTLTEASNLLDDLCRRGEIQYEKNIEMLLISFILHKGNYQVNL